MQNMKLHVKPNRCHGGMLFSSIGTDRADTGDGRTASGYDQRFLLIMHGIDMRREIQANIQGRFKVNDTLFQIYWMPEDNPRHPMLRDADRLPGFPDVVEDFSERAPEFHVRNGFFHAPPDDFIKNISYI
jgi:hypothetical protein